MTIDAKLIKTLRETKEKTQRLYKVIDDEILYPNYIYDEDDKQETTEYFLASRIIAIDHGDWETMLFPADEEGEILDWGEIYSIRGWEKIDTTVSAYIKTRRDRRNAKRLQANSDLMD